MDAWNGAIYQCQAFISNTGITYPLLRNAGSVSTLYAGGYDYVYIVGADGKVSYRNLSGWYDSEVVPAIQDALDELRATPAPPAVRQELRLAPPFPNPFNPRTSLVLELSVPEAPVTLTVFDQRGRRVRTLLDNQTVIGPRYSVVWDGLDDSRRSAPSGVYFFRVSSPLGTSVREGTLIR